MNKQKGFALIGLIISLAILFMMIYFAYFSVNKDTPQNQIQQGQDDVQKAKDAAKLETQYDQNLQNQVQGLGEPSVNYRAAQQQLDK